VNGIISSLITHNVCNGNVAFPLFFHLLSNISR